MTSKRRENTNLVSFICFSFLLILQVYLSPTETSSPHYFPKYLTALEE